MSQLAIELEYDAELLHGGDSEAVYWFYNDILYSPDGLTLHSKELGDSVGVVRVLRILS